MDTKNAGGIVQGVSQVANAYIKIGALEDYQKEATTDFEFARNSEEKDYSKTKSNQNVNMALSGLGTSTFTDILAESEANHTMNMGSIDRQQRQMEQEVSAQKKAAKISGVTGAISAVASAAAMFSDERLKEDLELIYTTENGIKIYEGKYREETGFKQERQSFMLAQEVEKIYPDAVIEEDGVKKVNYKLVLEREGLNG